MSLDDAALGRILHGTRTIAIVGISDREERDSHRVARYLQRAGYRIVPVNPRLETVLGEPCYPDLASVPVAVDLVNVFRRAEAAPAIARAAAEAGARSLWMQLGVVSEEAAAIARGEGLQVVMDRCIKVEHQRLRAGCGTAIA